MGKILLGLGLVALMSVNVLAQQHSQQVTIDTFQLRYDQTTEIHEDGFLAMQYDWDDFLKADAEAANVDPALITAFETSLGVLEEYCDASDNKANIAQAAYVAWQNWTGTYQAFYDAVWSNGWATAINDSWDKEDDAWVAYNDVWNATY